MRAVTIGLVLCLACSVRSVAQSREVPRADEASPEAAAGAILLELGSVQETWQGTPAEWRSTAAADASCQEFRQVSFAVTLSGVSAGSWSFRCAQVRPDGDTTWAFFALPDVEPLSVALVYWHRRFRVQPQAIPLVSALVRRAIEEAMGESRRPAWAESGAANGQRPDGAPEEWSPAWQDVRAYADDAVELLVYVEMTAAGEVPVVGMLARAPQLVSWIEETDRNPPVVLPSDVDRRLTERLSSAIGKTFPLLGLLVTESDEAQSLLQENGRDTLMGLLEAGAEAPKAERAPFLLAAHLVNTAWDWGEEIDPSTKPTMASFFSPEEAALLDRHDVDLEADMQAGVWHLGTSHLLWRVTQEEPYTEWGELATIYLLAHGWTTASYCGSGSDEFREVISNGERFLKNHEQSGYASVVRFLVARAYETWWSLSQAPVDADFFNRAGYLTGADEARLKAIEYYGSVLAEAPDSRAATEAKYRLPRLLLGLDTGQREFFCIPL